MTRRRIPDGVEKDFRVIMPKKLLKNMQKLVRAGTYQSYAEIIREGVTLVVQKQRKGGGRGGVTPHDL